MTKIEISLLHDQYIKAKKCRIGLAAGGSDLECEELRMVSDRNYFASKFSNVGQIQLFVRSQTQTENNLRRIHLKALSDMDQFAAGMRDEGHWPEFQ